MTYAPPRRPPARNAQLIPIAEHSEGYPHSGNRIVQGENLAVLRALQPQYRNRVRCIYIDPPYNNQERYTHYNDASSHDLWLEGLVERASMMREFLRDDGSFWVSIDDRGMHYLKAALDDVFGRGNFVTTIVWQHRTTRENRKAFSNNHEYVLLYAKDSKEFSRHRSSFALPQEVRNRYKNPDCDPRGPWQSVSLNAQGGHGTASQTYVLVAPNGRTHLPPAGRCWVYTKDRMETLVADDRIWFGKDGLGVPRLKKFMCESTGGIVPDTLWLAADVGTTDHAKKHVKALFEGAEVFDTPKPEALIARILSIATKPGDLVLDAYLGSGTTTAVAHKMRRRYIGIEQGAHAVSLCVERLRKVVAGADPGGITSERGWKGGGSFDFYRLCS